MDGLIDNLPPDGTWVRFGASGDAARLGQVIGTLTGSLTIKSVGAEQVNGELCRWIEIEKDVELKTPQGLRSKQLEVFKVLIPEKHLAHGQNPRDHILKAWKKDLRTGKVVEMNPKEEKSREIESLNEFFRATPETAEKHENVNLEVPGGKFQCTHVKSEEVSDAGDLGVQAWLTDKVPFGVASYHLLKTRKVNAQPVGNIALELKYSESGKDAKTTLAE